VEMMEISLPENVLQTERVSDVWTVHKNVIAVAKSSNTLQYAILFAYFI
jgi:hypothetical protein